MNKMNGVIPPMITPFTADGELYTAGLKKLVSFLSREVDGLFITGSYGAGPMMSIDERKQVLEVTMEQAGGCIPVIPMVGSTNNRDSRELGRHAESAGASAIAAVGPYYYTHQEDSLIDFYTDLIDSVSIPVYLYNNPGFQGYEISLDTIRKLKKRGLAGIKDATFDILLHATYQRVLADDDFDVVLGTESMFASAAVLGCKAFIPGLANAFPEINRKLFEEGMRMGKGVEGDSNACRETQFQINELREIMYLARSTQLAVYAMLEIRDIITAFPRHPFVAAKAEEIQAIREKLQALPYVSEYLRN